MKYAIHPGETLQEVMNDRNLSAEKLAQKMGIVHERLLDLLEGNVDLNSQLCHQLERGTNIPATFWMNLHNQYVEDRFK